MTSDLSVTLSAEQAHKVISHLRSFAYMMECTGLEMLNAGQFNEAVQAQVAASDAKHVARDMEKELRCPEEIPARRSQAAARARRRPTTNPRMEIVQ